MTMLRTAPLLVAIALIEAEMVPEESVDYVQAMRRSALNAKQVKFVRECRQDYKDHTGQHLFFSSAFTRQSVMTISSYIFLSDVVAGGLEA
ncbi:hypothetical protein BGZ74_003406, partial [Mortierella antarctica]